ncbi:MAG: mannose-phosphate guanylyltransferase [Gammaproteobacteria bacterium]|nr:mannose-phosphate guanylyltransferase [Gammaproteobacteria bacterium]
MTVTRTPEIPDAWVDGTWALVLAGGEGSRLRALTTTPNGVVVPKQFCSLRHGPSLLTQTLIRAGAVAPVIQTCAVVAAQHRWWWELPLGSLPRENVFVQPENRGTAHGVLLALLRLEARDPRATVLMLPADHYIRHEALFARSLRHIAELAVRTEDAIYLLGAHPDRADTELGYIVPADRKPHRPVRVLNFMEKPDAARARGLLRAGALWNMFILAGSVRALLDLYDGPHSSSLALMRTAIGGKMQRPVDSAALAEIYRQLPMLDFSRDLLEPHATRLQVLGIPPCGWNDLGTPKRVVETLHQLPVELERANAVPLPSAALSLADQYRRLSRHDNASTAL